MNNITSFVLGLFLAVAVPLQSSFATGLVGTLATEQGISEDTAKEQIKVVFSALKTELKKGNDVSIRKFGRFYLQDRKAREGRNPRTGDKIQIPAKKYPKFVSSDSFKAEMNQ